MRDVGAGSLSTAELLAILLRTGLRNENVLHMAERLLSDYGNLKALHLATFDELASQRGMAVAKTAQVKAALELGRRMQVEAPVANPVINSPKDVYDAVGTEMVYLDHEELRVLVVDSRNRVVHTEKLYQGTINASTLRTAEVFREAVRRNQPNIIVVHNHPSGDPTPSPDDEHATRLLVQAGDLLEIKVLDHIIVAHNEGQRYFSMKDSRRGFDS